MTTPTATIDMLRPFDRAAAAGALPAAGHILLATLALILWIALWEPPFNPGAVCRFSELDCAWGQALGHFFLVRAQAGVDYVFTYGPLGYFAWSPYHPDLFWWKYFWEAAVKLLISLLFLGFAYFLPGLWLRIIFLTAAIFLLPGHADQQYPLAIVLAGICLMRRDGLPGGWSAMVGLLATLALVKFTCFLLGSLAVGIAVAVHAVTGNRRRAAALGMGYLLVVFGWWLVLGQSLHHLPDYLAGSMEITRGYSEAMSCEGDAAVVRWAAWTMVLSVAGISLVLWIHRSWAKMPPLLLILAGVFLAWKHGMVRQDDSHAGLFFHFMGFVPFMAAMLWVWRDGTSQNCRGDQTVNASQKHSFRDLGLKLAAAGCLTAAFLAAFCCRAAVFEEDWTSAVHFRNFAVRWHKSLEFATQPQRLRGRRDAEWAEFARGYELPAIRSRIGDRTVDVMTMDQHIVFANGLSWRPRPIFQSYSAYTQRLAAANAAHFTGDKAPDFVIVRLTCIDGRLPAAEDGPALLAILRHYRPVLAERHYVLLERTPASSTAADRRSDRLEERAFGLDEWVEVDHGPGENLLLRLEMCQSLKGKLRTFFYRSHALDLQLRFDNGEVAGFRLVPAMSACEFLLSPFLASNLDLVALYGAPELNRRVTALAITAARPKIASSFAPSFRAVMRRTPMVVSQPIELAQAASLAFQPFDPPPTVVRSRALLRWLEVDDRPILLAVPPTELVFKCPPGAGRVSGRFGVLDAQAAVGQTDGVVFVIEQVDAEGNRTVLMQRHLQPARYSEHWLPVDFSLPLSGNGAVILRTENMPNCNHYYDLSYWADVKLR